MFPAQGLSITYYDQPDPVASNSKIRKKLDFFI